jgi:hypothetical protein
MSLYFQWRSQPDDSVPLCKYCRVYKISTQSISKEMNNDNELKFARWDQIVGLATPLCMSGTTRMRMLYMACETS